MDVSPVVDGTTPPPHAQALLDTGSSTSTAMARAVLRTVDFGGQKEYMYTNPLFFTPRAAYAVCVALDVSFGCPVEDIVQSLQGYLYMIHKLAPAAPVALVFTKADLVAFASPTHFPADVSRWIEDVSGALRAKLPQLAIGSSSGEPLVVSSKDGWEASQEHLRQQLARLALASPGAGDVLPHSYGAIRDALATAGAAWRQEPDDGPGSDGDGMEENKGEEGAPGAASFLRMRWGHRVPVASVDAVRDMAVRHCGLSSDADIRQPLALLHSSGSVLFGGALCESLPQGGVSHYDPPHLSQLVFLDVQWLANMLSRVVNRYARQRDDTGRPSRGLVSIHDVAAVFHGYPDDLRGSFIELLFALKVAYPYTGHGSTGPAQYLRVPALLPPTTSDTNDDGTIARDDRRERAELGVELKRLVAAMSMLVQWYWQDGSQLRVYSSQANARLEDAFQNGIDQVEVSVGSSTPHTVLLSAAPMIVQATGARVVRVTKATYVCTEPVSVLFSFFFPLCTSLVLIDGLGCVLWYMMQTPVSLSLASSVAR